MGSMLLVKILLVKIPSYQEREEEGKTPRKGVLKINVY